jgi:hypothetical protein
MDKDMVEVHIKDLTSNALNWAAATANNRHGTAAMIELTLGNCNYKPSTDPAIAYPIIEANAITTNKNSIDSNVLWTASVSHINGNVYMCHKNLLVAAMGLFVYMSDICNKETRIILIPKTLMSEELVPGILIDTTKLGLRLITAF